MKRAIPAQGGLTLLVLMLALVGSLALRMALRQAATRLRWDAAWLRLPVIGRLARGYNAARFAGTLAMLAGAGVPILKALQAAGTVETRAPRALYAMAGGFGLVHGLGFAGSIAETLAAEPQKLGFSLAPLQVFTMFAMACSAGSFLLVLIIAYRRLFLGAEAEAGAPGAVAPVEIDRGGPAGPNAKRLAAWDADEPLT